METIDHCKLKSLIEYDRETGDITWRPRGIDHFKTEASMKSWNTKYADKIASNVNTYSGKIYRRVTLLSVSYLQHRLVWFYVTGVWPDEVDHIDGNGLNNKWLNLRNVSRQINCKNARTPVDNTTGVPGVTKDSWTGRWLVRIGVNGKGVNLGRYDDFFQAVCCRKSAEGRLKYHENHGTVRPF